MSTDHNRESDSPEEILRRILNIRLEQIKPPKADPPNTKRDAAGELWHIRFWN